MPGPDALPEDLKALSRRSAVELRNTRFNVDSDLVVAAIKRRLGGARSASSEASDRTPAWIWASLIAVGIVLFSYDAKR